MKILLASHDPGWQSQFATERRALLAALGSLAVAVEHIGSTSILGIVAKPVIDIQVGVTSLAEFDAADGVQRFVSLGYRHRDDLQAMVPFRRYFNKSASEGLPAFQVHLVAIDHPWWRRHLAFRDYLRHDESARSRYESIKLQLATRDWDSTGDYAGAKTDIVLQLEEEAFARLELSDAEREWLRGSRVS